MTEDISFDERFALLQEEAIKRGKRIIQVAKGQKGQVRSADTSVGKPHKGVKKKRMSGEGAYYDQPKKRMSISLTDDMKEELTALAIDANLSRSETIERCLRIINKYPKLKPLVLEYIEDIAISDRIN